MTQQQILELQEQKRKIILFFKEYKVYPQFRAIINLMAAVADYTWRLDDVPEFFKTNSNPYNNNIKQEKNTVNENNLKYNINAKKNIELNKNSQRLDIEIGNIEMSWTNQDGLTKNVMLDKKDSEYLLDYPTSKWKFFIEQNIEKILSSDKGIIQPIKRSTKNNFIWKEFITKKEGIKE
jgi:hypothetical protein